MLLVGSIEKNFSKHTFILFLKLKSKVIEVVRSIDFENYPQARIAARSNLYSINAE